MITVEEIENDYRENIERAMEQLGHAMQDYPSNYGEAAYNVAIDAMEKQIPKKMIAANHMLACPNCEATYKDYSNGIGYCLNCGQRINWEDAE